MVIGRGGERARIGALLESARRGRTGTLVLVGEPGIGKTALVEDACATASGMRPLVMTAVESESKLPFAGLHALLRPLFGLIPALDMRQRRSLTVALALAEGEAPDLLAVNAGTLALLAEAAGEQPLLVAVDDVHWLDRPSADALAFAARRLEGEELAFLLATRTGAPTAFDRGFEHLVLEPLAREAARLLLERRREPVSPAAVEPMLDVAAGNPLALLELPVDLATGVPGNGATVSEHLQRAFTGRFDLLRPNARRAVVLAAADPDPAALRRAAAVLELGEDALAPAESAGLVVVDPNGVEFRHPLVRSLAYASADAGERRSAHRALAEAFADETDSDRRAWHLAAATTEPDEEVASLLEQTADRAMARGGHAAAARALERAARLSPNADDASRRLARSARAAWAAGDADRGLELAEEALASAHDPRVRAGALIEHTWLLRRARPSAHDEGRFLAAVGDLELLDADHATNLLLELVNWRTEALDVAGAMILVPRLMEVARRASPPWEAWGLGEAAAAYLAGGDSDRFLEVVAELREDDAATTSIALDLIWAEQYDAASYALETALRDARSSGNQMRVIWIEACSAHLQLRLGRLADARVAAAGAVTLAEAHGATRFLCVAECALAGVEAWQGNAEACRRIAAEAVAVAHAGRLFSMEFSARGALGLLALALGRPEEAVHDLAPAARAWQESSLVEPSTVAFVPDLVEAYVRTGQQAEARSLLDRFREAADATDRRWALAAVARCDGLLADPNGFLEPFSRSLALLESTPLALERARTQLVYGERLRRAGRRREARLHLREAYEAFVAADAVPWANRAADELGATGESVGARAPDRRTSLTPQELKIAMLVARGLTNKAIAAELYLSPKTIEYHLANTYRKLDVHSRMELARVLAEDEAGRYDG